MPHGGSTGFFPAAGTNYSVNQEPIIAARLDALGRALGLHLIGISGYRSPQHSVEVGGFADDPHTRGEASDTPGVEGVPEATLEEFCLTRPFPGRARPITSRSCSPGWRLSGGPERRARARRPDRNRDQSSPRKAAGRFRPGTSSGV